MGNSLTFCGPVGLPYSISKVLRETCLALNRMGYETGLYDPGAKGKVTWSEARYGATCRNLMRSKPGAINYALTDWGLPEDFTRMPGRKVRGFLYDEFKAEPNRIKVWNEAFEFMIAPSKQGRDWGASHGFKDIRCAPHGVNTLDYYPVSKSPDVLDKFRWITAGPIGPETLVILHSCTIQQRKGTRELLGAYRQAFQRGDNVVLLLHGSNAQWSEIKDLLGDLKRAPDAPLAWSNEDLTIAEQRRLYALASLTAHPNYCEGFGLSALESLACGTPVLIPDHSGNAEILDGRACYVLRGGKFEKHPRWRGFEWWRPDVDEVADSLRGIYNGRDQLAAKAAAAMEVASQHPWETGAALMAEWLDLTKRDVRHDGAVTVCTLARDKASMTDAKALATMQASVGVEFTHTLVDNGSREKAAMQAIAADRGCGYIRVDDPNKYGVVATNLVWCRGTLEPDGGYAQTEFVARLDNDCTIEPDGLAKMVAHMRAHPRCGVVGSVGLYANRDGSLDGTLWAAGWTWQPGTPWGAHLPGNKQAPLPSHYVDKHCWSVCFSCVLIRTELMLQLGGIWWEYNPCWYDDTDLCMATWNAGYTVDHIGNTVHTNERSATISGMGGMMAAKKTVFERNWKWLLEGDEPRVQDLIWKAI